jgi:hypothetical protein
MATTGQLAPNAPEIGDSEVARAYIAARVHTEARGGQVSVIVHARLTGDVDKLRQVIDSHPDELRAIRAEAEQRGCMHHRFLVGDGVVLIEDEWDEAEHFQSFFASQPKVAELVQEAGFSSPPDVTVYQVADSADAF